MEKYESYNSKMEDQNPRKPLTSSQRASKLENNFLGSKNDFRFGKKDFDMIEPLRISKQKALSTMAKAMEQKSHLNFNEVNKLRVSLCHFY